MPDLAAHNESTALIDRAALSAGARVSATRGQFRRESLARYAEPHLARSLLGIATSVVPYLGLSALMYLTLHVSYLLTLALAVPTAGFLVRTFIIFHDCTHGSYLPSSRANMWLGRATGLLVLVEHVLPDAWAGKRLRELGLAGQANLVAVTRGGSPRLDVADMVGQEGDVLHIAVLDDALRQFDDMLTRTKGRAQDGPQ